MRIPRGGTWPLAVVLLFCAGCSTPSVSPEPDPGAQASVLPDPYSGGQATASPEPDNGVQVLAKAIGWRWSLVDFHEVEDLYGVADPYGVVEVAYDEVTAAQAWTENVPADLVRRSGYPKLTGLYGDLADIDFDREALVVYSSGQSGTCPGWLTGIEVTERGRELGTVQLTTTFTTATPPTVPGILKCTADYRPYRLVLLVDRDRLPPISWLPTTRVLFNGDQLGGLVTTYPAEAG